MEERPEEMPVIVRAVDLMIADVEQPDDTPDRDDKLTLLRRLRESVLDGK